MVTRLYLIRHGETEGADAKRYKGHIDVPLSENGIKQMERLSKYLVQDSSSSSNRLISLNGLNGLSDLSAVYTSDLSRAVKSAEIIAGPHVLKPIIMPELRERNFGIWEGMSFDEIRVKYPEEFEAWADNPLKFKPMQGESTIEVRDRVVEALNKIIFEIRNRKSEIEKNSSLVTRHSSPNSIAIVSHGGVNRVILCHLLGIPLENIFRIEQDFGALNIIEFYDKYPVVKLVNYRV